MTAPLRTSDPALGLVFPVYAWGIPNIVEEFIKSKLKELLTEKPSYVYAVMTCGTDIGFADTLLRKSLGRIGLQLDAVFSVIMPNTYVSLPGFDIDSQEIASAKVEKARKTLPVLASKIQGRQKTTEVIRGSMAHFKSSVLRWFFNRYLITDQPFHVNDLRCTHCGKCIKQCPVSNIGMNNEKQIFWKGNGCTGCLGCYHNCPRHAIGYGRWTEGKGQKQAITD